MESLQRRYFHIQKQFEDIQKCNSTSPNTNQIIENVDSLIQRVRNLEEQIRVNTIQPTSDYEKLIPDCQVRTHICHLLLNRHYN